MDYRNERDALQSRVTNLEQALDEARSLRCSDPTERVARLEKQLADATALLQDIQHELAEVRGQGKARAGAGSGASRRAAAGWVVASLVACISLSAFWFVGKRARAKPSPPVVVQPAAIPPSPVAPLEPPRAVEPPEPQARPEVAAPRTAKPRWTATVRRAEGIALSPGARCFVDATVEATGPSAHVRDLKLTCGIRTLYSSSIAYPSDVHDDVRERLGKRNDESTFTLQYSDEARNGNQTSKLDLDTTRGTVVVERRIALEWRVELTVTQQSLPTAPLSAR